MKNVNCNLSTMFGTITNVHFNLSVMFGTKAIVTSVLFGCSVNFPINTRPIEEALLGGGMHVPRLNFKSCHVAISEGPYVAVGISSTATPERRRTSYVLLAAPKF